MFSIISQERPLSFHHEFASFQAKWSAPPEQDDSPNTVRGLLAYCRSWLTGEVSAEALHNPCWEMAGRLRAAAAATFRDLESNPELCDETRDPILDTGEGYETMAGILEDLATLAAEGRTDEFEEALAHYEDERLAVVDAKEEIQEQMDGDELRCPRCGERGDEDRCAHCRLTRLFPDPRTLTDYSHKSAELSSMHLELFRAYLSVVNGERSLEVLWSPLSLLTPHLLELNRFCNAQEDAAGSSRLVARLRESVALGARGADRMYSVANNRLTSELHTGWEEIFDSSVSIQEELRRYGVATGMIEQTPSLESDELQLGRRTP